MEEEENGVSLIYGLLIFTVQELLDELAEWPFGANGYLLICTSVLVGWP